MLHFTGWKVEIPSLVAQVKHAAHASRDLMVSVQNIDGYHVVPNISTLRLGAQKQTELKVF